MKKQYYPIEIIHLHRALGNIDLAMLNIKDITISRLLAEAKAKIQTATVKQERMKDRRND